MANLLQTAGVYTSLLTLVGVTGEIRPDVNFSGNEIRALYNNGNMVGEIRTDPSDLSEAFSLNKQSVYDLNGTRIGRVERLWSQGENEVVYTPLKIGGRVPGGKAGRLAMGEAEEGAAIEEGFASRSVSRGFSSGESELGWFLEGAGIGLESTLMPLFPILFWVLCDKYDETHREMDRARQAENRYTDSEEEENMMFDNNGEKELTPDAEIYLSSLDWRVNVGTGLDVSNFSYADRDMLGRRLERDGRYREALECYEGAIVASFGTYEPAFEDKRQLLLNHYNRGKEIIVGGRVFQSIDELPAIGGIGLDATDF